MVKWLLALLGSSFTGKVFTYFLVTVVLSIVLYNFIVLFIQESMTFALTQINGVEVGSVASPSISGFAGWFLVQVKVAECFAVMVSAVSIRFVLRKIPFIKW